MDKANQVRFFEKIFLIANVSPEIVLGMPFLTLSSADIDFLSWGLRWKTHTTKEAFPTTWRIKLVKKKEFAAIALDPKYKIYVVYIASLSSTLLITFDVHPFRRSQISEFIA